MSPNQISSGAVSASSPEMSDAQCRFDLLIINHGRIFGVGRVVHMKNAWQ
jgi:Holliday junction resolvase-like predicted endonuclease